MLTSLVYLRSGFFSASGHGKNSADGIGGTVKKLARLEAKRRDTTGQMLTPFDLFFWAKTAIPSIEFIYVPAAADIEEWTRKLERRFKRAVAIPGTRSFHCYVATRKPGELIASTLPDPLSSLPKETFDVVPSLFSPFTCPDLKIDMLLALEFGGDWWLGKLQDIFDEAEEVIVKFYHPVGSQSSASGFYFPNERDEIT